MSDFLKELKRRKRHYYHRNENYETGYAFIGLGSHALNNLYPVLDYLHIPIKLILTKSERSAQYAKKWYPNAKSTTCIDDIIYDNTINNCFISIDPKSQYDIVKKLLATSKNIFVEKPVCESIEQLKELNKLKEQNNCNLMVGMQKRYAPAISLLKSKINKPLYYTLQYKVGAYPEGNAIYELFIHPIDLIVFLFGKGSIAYKQRIIKNKENVYLLTIEHESGVYGSLELSTIHSWTDAYEQLNITSETGVYTLNNCQHLTFQPAKKTLFGIPIDKVINTKSEQLTLYNTNSFLPIASSNQLYTNGYVNEIKSFTDLCEKRSSINLSSPELLLSTYSILETLK